MLFTRLSPPLCDGHANEVQVISSLQLVVTKVAHAVIHRFLILYPLDNQSEVLITHMI